MCLIFSVLKTGYSQFSPDSLLMLRLIKALQPKFEAKIHIYLQTECIIFLQDKRPACLRIGLSYFFGLKTFC